MKSVWDCSCVLFPFSLEFSLSFNISLLPQTCLQIPTHYSHYYNYIPGAMGAQHMVLNEEQAAFSDWINNNLRHDKDVSHLLPLNVRLRVIVVVVWFIPCVQDSGSDLYSSMDDGILLCKMINLATPDTIDERVINKAEKLSIFKVSIAILAQLTIILITSNMRTSHWQSTLARLLGV